MHLAAHGVEVPCAQPGGRWAHVRGDTCEGCGLGLGAHLLTICQALQEALFLDSFLLATPSPRPGYAVADVPEAAHLKMQFETGCTTTCTNSKHFVDYSISVFIKLYHAFSASVPRLRGPGPAGGRRRRLHRQRRPPRRHPHARRKRYGKYGSRQPDGQRRRGGHGVALRYAQRGAAAAGGDGHSSAAAVAALQKGRCAGYEHVYLKWYIRIKKYIIL